MEEEDVLVFHLLLLLGFNTTLLEREEVTAALKADRRNQTLDLRPRVVVKTRQQG